MTSEELIAEVGRRIAEAAPGATLIVFGSHARGEANKYSDLDLLVIEPEVENTAAESVRLRDVLADARLTRCPRGGTLHSFPLQAILRGAGSSVGSLPPAPNR